jgi:hypothetical protein
VTDQSIRFELDAAEYRRLLAIAGRRGLQPEGLIRNLIERLLLADRPGKVNPVLRAIDPPPLGPPVRHCRYCGKALPPAATVRRKYCRPACRVAGNRRQQRA